MSPQEEALVDAILASGITLPAPDSQLLDLMQLAANEDTGLDEIAGAVSRTPATAGAVFRVASSPVFGQVRPKKNVLEAVVLLGKTKVLAIATSTALRSKLGDVPQRVLDAIWDRSFEIAQASWSLMHASRFIQICDQAFLAALMHEVGTALILRRNPEFLTDYDLTAANVDEAGRHFDTLSEVRHAAIGAHVARNWKLPSEVCEAIGLHHSPPIDGSDEAHGPALRLAAAVAAGRRHCRSIGDDEWAAWAPYVESELGIPADAVENGG